MAPCVASFGSDEAPWAMGTSNAIVNLAAEVTATPAHIVADAFRDVLPQDPLALVLVAAKWRLWLHVVGLALPPAVAGAQPMGVQDPLSFEQAWAELVTAPGELLRTARLLWESRATARVLRLTGVAPPFVHTGGVLSLAEGFLPFSHATSHWNVTWTA